MNAFYFWQDKLTTQMSKLKKSVQIDTRVFWPIDNIHTQKYLLTKIVVTIFHTQKHLLTKIVVIILHTHKHILYWQR